MGWWTEKFLPACHPASDGWFPISPSSSGTLHPCPETWTCIPFFGPLWWPAEPAAFLGMKLMHDKKNAQNLVFISRPTCGFNLDILDLLFYRSIVSFDGLSVRHHTMYTLLILLPEVSDVRFYFSYFTLSNTLLLLNGFLKSFQVFLNLLTPKKCWQND